MFKRIKGVFAVACSTAMVAGVAASPAAAQGQNVDQDGLVNVNVGNVEVAEDVTVLAAAQVVVQACGLDVGPVNAAILGQITSVDKSGRTRTFCQNGEFGAFDGPVTVSNND